MSERTFFVPPSAVSAGGALLEGAELGHARSTLRLGPGDEVRLLDGAGTAHTARIEAMTHRSASLKILSSATEPEPAFMLTVAMGIVPGERFEWALQKGVELGARAFIPLLTDRTEARIRGAWKRKERLERIIVSACKQCQRARFPTLHDPVALDSLDPSLYELSVFFWEAPGVGPLEAGRRPRTALMAVGPVGGFSDREAALLVGRGFVPAGLGPRILRTETAVAAGAALMQYLYGDMGLIQKKT